MQTKRPRLAHVAKQSLHNVLGRLMPTLRGKPREAPVPAPLPMCRAVHASVRPAGARVAYCRRTFALELEPDTPERMVAEAGGMLARSGLEALNITVDPHTTV